MPAVLPWAIAAALGYFLLKEKVEDATAGAPSPFGSVGIVVYGLAAYGGWQLFRTVK